MILLRSVLFTPGTNLRMMSKAGTLGADAVILDLEDAVPIADKETARVFVRDTIPQLIIQRSHVFVRVNALTTGLTAQDLEWIVQPGLNGVILPKTETRADIAQLDELLNNLEQARGMERASLRLIPILETAKGVMAAQEIAAGCPRLLAMAFGGVDFARDMGISLTREGEELFHARAHVGLAARAARLTAIDAPWIDLSDAEGLVAHARRARQLGFGGKLLIHPSQVSPVNRVFSPTAEEIAYAKKVTESFREAAARGLGAISLDGKMIDAANYQQAKDLIGLSEAIGRLDT